MSKTRQHQRQHIAERIVEARRKAGFRNATDFALAVGVSKRTVEYWESAKYAPKSEHWPAIARVTKTPVSVLLGEESEEDVLRRQMQRMRADLDLMHGLLEARKAAKAVDAA